MPLGLGLPICIVRVLDSMISQAPSRPVPSALSYNSLDMASPFKGQRCLHVKHRLGQEFLANFSLPPANLAFSHGLNPQRNGRGRRIGLVFRPCASKLLTLCKKIDILLYWLVNSHFPQLPQGSPFCPSIPAIKWLMRGSPLPQPGVPTSIWLHRHTAV